MDFFDVLNMIGGLALFLYGMHAMGEGLEKLSGGKLERILEKLTSNPVKAVLLGAGVTAVIQSSSATTVMVVGFVNSRIMGLKQAVGIIMGANIGTTITAWILSLSGIESSNFFVQLLKPTSFSPILALVGIVFLMFCKKEKKKDIGIILVGFAILMFGMDAMSTAVAGLKDVPEFTNILTMFSNPILGMLAGALLTAVIQSSSASVGILQALCSTGTVGYSTALPIIMGQNIGTCVTALLSSIGANKNAKRAAFVHLYFNIIGTTVFMGVFYLINAIFPFEFMGTAATELGIAVIHTIYNVIATLILLPFSSLLVKLATLTVSDKKTDNVQNSDFQVLDPRFIDKPAFAIEQCKSVTVKMAQLCKTALFNSIELFNEYDEKKLQEVIRLEEEVDRYEDELGTYLVKVSSKNLSESDSRTLSMLLHSIGDFERISDHAVNIAETAKEMHEKKLKFSEKAEAELTIFTKAIMEILDTTVEVFEKGDVHLASYVEPLEEVIDTINAELKARHVRRLREGKCTIELGFVLSDITTNYERVADHCSNIAVCLIQISENLFDTHEYLEKVKKGDNREYNVLYDGYKKRFMLPQ